MARRRKKTGKKLGSLLILGGLAAGGYYLYSTGKLDPYLPDPMKKTPTDPTPDVNPDPIEPDPDGNLFGSAIAALSAFLSWKNSNTPDDTQPPPDSTDPPQSLWEGLELPFSIGEGLAAAAVAAGGLAGVYNQGMKWGEVYSELSDSERGTVRSITHSSDDMDVIPSSVTEARNLYGFASTLPDSHPAVQLAKSYGVDIEGVRRIGSRWVS